MRAGRSLTVAVIVGLLATESFCGGQDPAGSAGPATAPDEITIHEALVIGDVGRYGRTAVHVDAIENLLVTDQWAPPQAGQSVTLPDGATRTWEPVSTGDDGWFRHAGLRRGYAYAAIDSPTRQLMRLEASGHSLVYVNGQPRAGDPYQTGYVRLPVLLKPGTNHLLFACGRGELRAKLVAEPAPVAIDLHDATLPDLIVGERPDAWAAVVIVNARETPLDDAHLVACCDDTRTATPLPPVARCSVRKAGFRITGPAPAEPGKQEVQLVLYAGAPESGEELARETVELRVREAHQDHRRTFVSALDGSVQYYAVQPMSAKTADDQWPALFLSLHGAGVEATSQARSYASKSWGYVVAPTNRRPFGFDWEDWGRGDAIEVLDLARQAFGTDPQRTYLTGHSMGGHGVWHVGATFPDRFAAIAPSAGWISFWSYAGAQRLEDDTPIAKLLSRATNPSDTLALSRNYLHYGMYILHGERDDNVPVEQARQMREHLAKYHADFAYYERPGAGHWWGNACVDWPPLFDFLRHHTRPEGHAVQHVEFVTANPAVSATCYWATIVAQIHSLDFSKVDLHVDKESQRIHGETENVARLRIALGRPHAGSRVVVGDSSARALLEPGKPLTIELDGQKLTDIPRPPRGAGDLLCLVRQHEEWVVLAPAESAKYSNQKGPHRAGPFKEVFRNRVQFVYGTCGTPEENAWAFAKARYDAETFWYRGNGSIDVIADTEFDPAAEPDRNVVLYGNADSNAVWPALFGPAPVQVPRGQVRVGEREIEGSDLAVLAIHPRPNSRQALVGVVSGSGLEGMRLTERLPYFVSGVAYPDWTVLGTEVLQQGTAGVRGVGFYGNDWSIDPEQSAWCAP